MYRVLLCLPIILCCVWANAATSGTLDLLDALNAGEVTAEFYGAGDDTVTGYIERNADGPQSLEISPGTQFWAQRGGIQGQTNLGAVPVDLTTSMVAWVSFPTCCTNIGLPAPTEDDVMIPVRCPDERLEKLLSLPDIKQQPHFGVQVAVWALANNPRPAQVWRVVSHHRVAGAHPEGAGHFFAQTLNTGAALLRRIGLDPATFSMFG